MKQEEIKKQLSYRRPKKIIKLFKLKTTLAACPTCKFPIDIEFTNYCPTCGQELNWQPLIDYLEENDIQL